MKRAVEQLRVICRDNLEALPLLDALDRWSEAIHALEFLGSLSDSINKTIAKHKFTIKMNETIGDMLITFKDDLELPESFGGVDRETLSAMRDEICDLARKRDAIDSLLTLIQIEQMTEAGDA